MINLARRHYPEWPGEYASCAAVAFWRLAIDESSIHLRRIRYKFSWRGHETGSGRYLLL